MVQRKQTAMNNEKHYPQADEWMWDYCTFLGKFEGKEGGKYDLGVFVDTLGVSAAIVYSNEPGAYYSGDLDHFGRFNDGSEHDEIYKETRRRAKEAGLYRGKI